MLILKYPCANCGNMEGDIVKAGVHNKLICSSCKKYIKMVPKKDIDTFLPVKPLDEHQQILSKLNLIIKHLGIKDE